MNTSTRNAAVPMEADLLDASRALWQPYSTFMNQAIDRLEARQSAAVKAAPAPVRQPLRPGLWTRP